MNHETIINEEFESVEQLKRMTRSPLVGVLPNYHVEEIQVLCNIAQSIRFIEAGMAVSINWLATEVKSVVTFSNADQSQILEFSISKPKAGSGLNMGGFASDFVTQFKSYDGLPKNATDITKAINDDGGIQYACDVEVRLALDQLEHMYLAELVSRNEVNASLMDGLPPQWATVYSTRKLLSRPSAPPIEETPIETPKEETIFFKMDIPDEMISPVKTIKAAFEEVKQIIDDAVIRTWEIMFY